MPTVSIFYGIVIRMYVRDHLPPDFHAIYGGSEAFVAIESGDVLEGELPRNAARLVKEWATLHRDDLMENWRRTGRDQPPFRIEALDAGKS